MRRGPSSYDTTVTAADQAGFGTSSRIPARHRWNKSGRLHVAATDRGAKPLGKLPESDAELGHRDQSRRRSNRVEEVGEESALVVDERVRDLTTR